MTRFLIFCFSFFLFIFPIGWTGVVQGQTASLEKAGEIYNQVNELYEKDQGEQAQNLLKSLLRHLDDAGREVADLYQSERYAEAVPIAAGIVDLRTKVLGRDHPETAAALSGLADLYLKLADYQHAETLYKNALEIRKKELGPEDLETVQSLINLAVLYQAMNDPHQAEPLYRQALTIREKVLGPDHPATADCLNYLALLYMALGEYDQSEPLLVRVLNIREKALGQDHPETIDSMKNLASFQRYIGEWEKSETVFKQAAASLERLFGPDHLETAEGWQNLAGLYFILGRFDEAESFYQKALAVRKTLLGDADPAMASTLNQLGLVYQAGRQYEKSEQALAKALEIREKALGPDHPDVAGVLNNLGDLYRVRGDVEKAEPLIKRALVIWEKSLGPDHPNRAAGMNSLGLLYKEQADYMLAGLLFQQALTIWEKTYGRCHPDLVVEMENLAALSAAKGDSMAAFEYLEKAQGILDELTELSFGASSDHRRLRFLSMQCGLAQQSISLAGRCLFDSAESRKEALDIWLKYKGSIYRPDNIGALERDDPKDRNQDLVRIRRNLARLTFGGPGLMSLETYSQKLKSFQAQYKELESKSAEQAGRNQVDADAVARALPEGSALLEFACVGYDPWDPVAMDGQQADHYLAFVLPAGQEAAVDLVPLGPARPIDDTVTALRKAIRDDEDVDSVSKRLYDQVFSRVQSSLGETGSVYVVPDGQLSLIPFEVLQNPEGRYLIENHMFHYLTSGRAITSFKETKNISRSPILVAAPDFDLDLNGLNAVRKQMGQSPLAAFLCSPDLKGPFTPLDAASADLDHIASILNNPGTTKHTGRNAIEETVYRARAPWILHLDTHAFFLPDQEARNLSFIQSPRLRLGIKPDKSLMRPQKDQNKYHLENPNLRSGLAFAGANSSLQKKDVAQSQGILTSEKIRRINLHGTDLVFLPRCDTGRGGTAVGEDLYGLREAFLNAGARSIIMTLWPVPDDTRRSIITTFYQNLVQQRTPRRQALQDAILSEIARLKDQHENKPSPLNWAAFIHLGQP